jgi:signal peptidase I
MATFTKLLCLSLLLLNLTAPAAVKPQLYFEGDYFLYCQELNYIYGSGGIVLRGDSIEIRGDVLYLDVQSLKGVVYGHIAVKSADRAGEPTYRDALFFQAFPFEFSTETYSDQIIKQGKQETGNWIVKREPQGLKDYAIYYEFREFSIDANRKVRARTVIPYVMGIPSVPLKRLTIKRGKLPEKTLFYFKNINYSDLDGLSLHTGLQVRGGLLRGDYNLKLYERALFKLPGIKRGALFSGSSDLSTKKTRILNLSTVLNSGEKSFNLRLHHHQDLGFLDYALSQTVSGREGSRLFLEFSSYLTLKKLKYIRPKFEFSHDLEKSYSYKISTPVYVWKKMNLHVGLERRVLRNDFRSDTLDFSSSLAFNFPLVNLSSSFYHTRDLVQSMNKNNFSLNLNFKPLTFLEKNVSFRFSSFYMFSAFPGGETVTRKSTPGVNVNLSSRGIGLPIGFTLQPSLSVNHIWDEGEEDFTDFNYLVSLKKRIGPLVCGLDYSLVSRYRSRSFWVEGYNTPNLNLNFQWQQRETHLQLRFFYNNEIKLENISLSGQLKLPLGLKLSSFILYYRQSDRFQTVEVFLEKVFKHKIKIQGGYSLALKRFFIKFLLV